MFKFDFKCWRATNGTECRILENHDENLKLFLMTKCAPVVPETSTECGIGAMNA